MTQNLLHILQSNAYFIMKKFVKLLNLHVHEFVRKKPQKTPQNTKKKHVIIKKKTM